MTKVEEYAKKLNCLADWKDFLMVESGLPGPRGNLELAEAAAKSGTEAFFTEMLAYTPEKAPVNSPEEFLHFCGVLGQGELLLQGKKEVLATLRRLASDPRWRTREAVAMALQRYGEEYMEDLLREMQIWAAGNEFEKRAAAAALCEPKLLKDAGQAAVVLRILDKITETLAEIKDRKSEGFIALKKGLAYCWSVAAAANPEEGKKLMEKWAASADKEIQWIIKENLKKKRLERMDAAWLAKQKELFGL